MHNQQSLAQRTKPAPLPNDKAPYFGSMTLNEGGKLRTILVGHTPLLSSFCDYPIIDWRSAPLAKIFFQYREGEEFEVELPGRMAHGTLEQRNIARET